MNIIINKKLQENYRNDVIHSLVGKVGSNEPTFPMYLMNNNLVKVLDTWNGILFTGVINNQVIGDLANETNQNRNLSSVNINFLDIFLELKQNDTLKVELLDDIIGLVKTKFFSYAPSAFSNEVKTELRTELQQHVLNYGLYDETDPENKIPLTPFTVRYTKRDTTTRNKFKADLQKFVTNLVFDTEVLTELFNGNVDFPATSDSVYDVFKSSLGKTQLSDSVILSKLVPPETSTVLWGTSEIKVNTTRIETSLELNAEKPLLLESPIWDGSVLPHKLSYIPDSSVVFMMGLTHRMIPEGTEVTPREFINYQFVQATLGYDKFLENFDFDSIQFEDDLAKTSDIYITCPRDFEDLPQPDFINETNFDSLKTNKIDITFFDGFYLLKSIFY